MFNKIKCGEKRRCVHVTTSEIKRHLLLVFLKIYFKFEECNFNILKSFKPGETSNNFILTNSLVVSFQLFS